MKEQLYIEEQSRTFNADKMTRHRSQARNVLLIAFVSLILITIKACDSRDELWIGHPQCLRICSQRKAGAAYAMVGLCPGISPGALTPINCAIFYSKFGKGTREALQCRATRDCAEFCGRRIGRRKDCRGGCRKGYACLRTNESAACVPVGKRRRRRRRAARQKRKSATLSGGAIGLG